MQTKTKNTLTWIGGLTTAALVGFVQGAGVEQIIVDQIGDGIKHGDMGKFFGYAAIFFLIWLPVRGLKKEVAKLNDTIAKSFARGETRFTALERQQLAFEHRLTELEALKPIH